MDRTPATLFVDESELDHLLPVLRTQRCERCGRRGTWVGHGAAYGYAADGSRQVRGRRVLCTNRGRRQGCGRTQTVLVATSVRGFVASTGLLWSLLCALCAGQSVRGLWSCSDRSTLSLTLRSGHRLAARLRRALPLLNPRLARLVEPPPSTCRDPIGALDAHLRAAFPDASDPLAALQWKTQRGLFDVA